MVCDWAGTTVDHGSRAPVLAFIRLFAARGVSVTPDEVRAPMGLHKKEHIRALLVLPAVTARWRARHGRDPVATDVDDLYHAFMPLQLEVLDDCSRLVPEVLDCVAELRRSGVRIGATTGYFREAAARVERAARAQGYWPDCSVCADDVPAGRPAPWMIFRIMEALVVYPPATVVKVGDTVPDIGEGRAAGAWSVGVLRSGSEVGCTEAEWDALPSDERSRRLAAGREKLLAAGAHAVGETLAELPALVTELTARLRRGEKP